MYSETEFVCVSSVFYTLILTYKITLLTLSKNLHCAVFSMFYVSHFEWQMKDP